MSSNITDTTYFSIQAWMVTKLNLKGCERDVYAIIYGYSQDGESDYHGSLGYMAELTGYSKNSICIALKNLTDKRLIIKTEKEINNIKFCKYQINCDSIQATCMPIQATCTNNKQDNTNNNNSKELLQNRDFQFGKQKPKKDNLYSKCVALIRDKTDDPELQKLLIDWFNMLLEKFKDKGRPLYANVFKGKLNMLDKYDERDWKDIVEYNLQRGYEGLYPIHQIFKSSMRTNFRESVENLPHTESMTQEDYEELERITEERKRLGLRTEF